MISSIKRTRIVPPSKRKRKIELAPSNNEKEITNMKSFVVESILDLQSIRRRKF